ncbi:MAG TPA: ThiF family adenylyltransferase [Cyclobacteriaceae bacterium]|nr:ThiF family adenylyltransferase [Cyclobacteriaceae bacterium]HMV09290.1 ThiF family adenylyltransferase [Cyclobacteriaceae bacterium]HMX01910.1 ThiF family adenylyltransferase [Cyclobacteriaceae bacterium]HMX50833.1 ThiF family adenylyltransferase [Cyclobacteriaceae bacterium]HMY94733.1 ThiF family adenylyltransferase [Cyclobacteriaceae bacterium]
MSRLVIPLRFFEDLKKSLFRDEHERCAVMFARSVRKENLLSRIVVFELMAIDDEWYDYRGPAGVQVKSELIAQLAQRSRRTGDSIVLVHNHPFSFNQFSDTDDLGETRLEEFFTQRTPGIDHVSMLITPDTVISRLLGKAQYLKTAVVGPVTQFYWQGQTSVDARYDRQVRIFGKAGQHVLGELTIGIVGLGGTGSVVAQQLAHLGVNKFLLIDPDLIEQTNLNRVAGSTRRDIGLPKIDLAKRFITQINPDARVSVIQDSVNKNTVAEFLADTDLSFCCTDSHGSRAVINQLAYQYLLPVIDMGVVISTHKGTIRDIAARTQLLVPGLGCLVCGNILDPEQVRRDLLSDFERKSDPYIVDADEPAPAVMSLNSTIASLSVTMLLNCVLGMPGLARALTYNAINGTVRHVVCPPQDTCVVCSESGSLCKAHSWPLPGRKG